MDTLEFFKKRRSIRKYQDREVPKEVLEVILEAGRIAPSARNAQPWKFIVVTDADTRQALAGTTPYKFVAKAPLIIVACALESQATLGARFDVAIAMDHMSLAAANMGIGNCWVAGFDREAVRKILGVPQDVDVVVMMTFGYPAEEPRPRPVKDMSEVVSYGRF